MTYSARIESHIHTYTVHTHNAHSVDIWCRCSINMGNSIFSMRWRGHADTNDTHKWIVFVRTYNIRLHCAPMAGEVVYVNWQQLPLMEYDQIEHPQSDLFWHINKKRHTGIPCVDYFSSDTLHKCPSYRKFARHKTFQFLIRGNFSCSMCVKLCMVRLFLCMECWAESDAWPI